MRTFSFKLRVLAHVQAEWRGVLNRGVGDNVCECEGEGGGCGCASEDDWEEFHCEEKW